MIHVINTIKIKNGKRDKFIEQLRENIPNVKKEKGCIEYSPAYEIETKVDKQVFDGNKITIIQKWKSIYSLQDHIQSPHMVSFWKNVQDLIEYESLKILSST